MRVIELQSNGDWAIGFREESSLIKSSLGDIVVDIHHIGSTAIPGIDAKPIIDIVLEVSSINALDESGGSLTLLGYESLGEYGLAGRRFFRKGGDRRTHHVHAYGAGHPDIHRHIVFRDYLIAHPEKAAMYERVKLDAASRFRESPDDYAAAKSVAIRNLEKEALIWAGS